MSNMQQRKDEILEKRARLEELRRQRELRARTSNRAGMGTTVPSPPPNRPDRFELENLINSLVGQSRPVSTTPGVSSPVAKESRPNSVLSAGELSNATTSEFAATANGTTPPVRPPAFLTAVPLITVYECPPSPVKETHSYNKGVQTVEPWTSPVLRARATSVATDADDPFFAGATSTPGKRMSRRERDREEELRQNIRREIEEELRAAKEPTTTDGPANPGALGGANYPARNLTAEEVEAVTSSSEFRDFVEKSAKVIERALDQELDYDILTDYALRGRDPEDDDDDAGNTGGKGKRRVKEVAQFYDERWSRRRMVSGIDFSPKFAELFLASYTKNPAAPQDPDGLVQVWNMHMSDRPEFVFTAQSDVLTAKFSPYHPNLVVGGSYSGQVLLWDTRAKAAPVQKTPLTGFGHTHPVYCVDVVGTQNANNIISGSSDGAVCAWSMDVFAQPQESLLLRNPSHPKIEDVNVTCLAFPHADPTFFLAGTEEGPIFPCHRYDRAGAKAGVDPKVSYRGHAAPVMSIDFHPARGIIDLGDLVLSSSLDWTVKLWRARAPAANSSLSPVGEGQVKPLIEFVREDVVYDARWSPVKPGVFALVDGAGSLELWDLAVETEVPVAKITPTTKAGERSGMYFSRSLSKVAWEQSEGKRLATGGLDGSVSVLEVASGLGGKEELKSDEWTAMKRLVSRVEAVGVNGAVV